MSEWISVDERLPEPGVMVMARIGGMGVMEAYIDVFGKWQFRPIVDVSEWRQLPGAGE